MDDSMSKKIFERISVQTVAEGLISILELGRHEKQRTLSKKMKKHEIFDISDKDEEGENSAQDFYKPSSGNNKVANLDSGQAEFELFDILGSLNKKSSKG